MDYQYKGVLVTGGAGFIGSHLVDALAQKGCQVVVLDNLSTGCLENLAGVRDQITFIKGDITNRETLEKTVKGCDIIFHLAAQVSVPLSIEKPVESAQTNQAGALLVLDAARRLGVRRVILASSCAVYGDTGGQPCLEEMTGLPLSPYALQKLVMEHYASLYSRMYGLETVCLRYFNVYGPRQSPNSEYSGVISLFLSHAWNGTVPVIYGDGRQTRDFIHVSDVVRANLQAAQTENGFTGRSFNIGTGQATSITDLWHLISRLTCANPAVEYAAPRSGDIATSLADICQARDVLGFESRLSLENGLMASIENQPSQECNVPSICKKD